MPFVTPYEFTALELVTAALMNGMQDNAQALYDGLTAEITDKRYCVVYKSSTQSFSSGSAADITWNQELTDTQGWHDNSSNSQRITVTETGTYLPFVAIYWNKDSGGSGVFHINARIQKNGTDTANKIISYQEVSAVSKQFTFGGIPVSMTAGQYLSVNFSQDSGGPGVIYGTNENYSSFSVMKLP